ncbi:dtw domain-containing protein [Anaeramoeba flamelloides]|uniref:tRNA-uridine aminocarboxypropyltransferase 1 n=1 Tax=Anaeramoeba flamelloides TaxID=1746091 RepID=A0AAV7YUX0_9EUKA|nr:dtw domain-containing protein [Anaeramoeba flamelloides]
MSLDLKLASFEGLDDEPRKKCPNCERTCKFYCPHCFTIVNEINKIPQLTLPLKTYIVHHPKEKVSKSTAIHAKVLAPESVEIIEFPLGLDALVENSENDQAFDLNSTLLLFPSEESKPISEVDWGKIKNVVFIDSTWLQTRRILRDPRIKNLPKIQINAHKTRFWRHQKVSDYCLATIEAIYFFFKEFVAHKNNGKYEGQVDNLLFFFEYTFQLIQKKYKREKRPFKHIKGYIKNDDNDDEVKENQKEKEKEKEKPNEKKSETNEPTNEQTNNKEIEKKIEQTKKKKKLN